MLIAGRYRLLDLVGRGGMGRVWRARDEMLHREVAVKEVVPPTWLADHERAELRSRTLREARTAARLNHPAVVRLYDVVPVEGSPWIVMEYVPSRTLQDVLDTEGPLDPARAARIGLALLDALEAAHIAGVLHRDIKPQNVLVAHDGRVMLTDFGLATFDGGDGAMTRPGMVLGSPQYVAPERAAEGVSTVAADLWSLGATLHAAVEGRSPYARSNAMATLSALAAGPPDPAPHAGPLAPVLDGLLRRDPRDRLDHDGARRLLTAAASGRTPDVTADATGRTPNVTADASDGAGSPVAAGPAGATRSPAAAGPPAQASSSGDVTAPTTAQAVPHPVGTGVGPPADTPSPSGTSADQGVWTGDADSGPSTDAGIRTEDAYSDSGPSTDQGVRTGDADSDSGPSTDQGVRTGGAYSDSGRSTDPGIRAGDASSDSGPHGDAGVRPPVDASAATGQADRRSTARRAALVVTALLVAVAAGVGTALAVSGDSPTDTAGRTTTPAPDAGNDGRGPDGGYDDDRGGPHRGGGPGRPGPPPGGRDVPPPPFPCVRPDVAGAPVTAGSPRAGERFRPPSGWVWHADTSGFRVSVPATWYYSREGSVACFQDPATGRALSVAEGGAADPLTRLRTIRDEAARDGALPGYDEIRLATDEDGAQWECRWNAPDGPRLHARQQIVGAERWTLGWITDDRDWTTAGADWSTVRKSFRPPR